jgi:pyridoxal phosphate enzyme (YggS family)
MDDRRDAMARGLTRVRERIDQAARSCGRDPSSVTLIVVTKTFPADDVRRLADLGVREVGENRHPEAEQKALACADLPVRWHYIGRLQSNKARAVARYADAVHSIDRLKLVGALARGREEAATGAEPRPLDCLVQVSLDPPEQQEHRGGLVPEQVPALAEAIGGHDLLRCRGVMGVAPLGGDPQAAFGRLAEVAARVRDAVTGADWISAGMSGDLEAAIAHGATHVRVGSAILGTRPTPR